MGEQVKMRIEPWTPSQSQGQVNEWVKRPKIAGRTLATKPGGGGKATGGGKGHREGKATGGGKGHREGVGKGVGRLGGPEPSSYQNADVASTHSSKTRILKPEERVEL